MPGTLVDSNVILDVLTEDPKWYAWSSSVIERCANEGPLYINPIIYAEVSIGFAAIEEVEEALPPESFLRLQIPTEAAFLAGKAFLRYRRGRGAGRPLCLTSSSALTPLWLERVCSREIVGVTGPIFLR